MDCFKIVYQDLLIREKDINWCIKTNKNDDGFKFIKKRGCET